MSVAASNSGGESPDDDRRFQILEAYDVAVCLVCQCQRKTNRGTRTGYHVDEVTGLRRWQHSFFAVEVDAMSKGMDRKKETKKKPSKTKEEKRAAKKAKR